MSRKFRTAPVVRYVAMPSGLHDSISNRMPIFLSLYSTSASVTSSSVASIFVFVTRMRMLYHLSVMNS